MSTYRQVRLATFCVLGDLILFQGMLPFPLPLLDRLTVAGIALLVVGVGVGIEYADRLSDWAERKQR